ncbi:MAG: integrase catalytic domain-containing protein [Clostridium sp.]|uniref:integrase catalytic domain-containing protein n=1 Tax=Clostridium sp. TaxID=1506 RepID=UPI003F2ECBEE
MRILLNSPFDKVGIDIVGLLPRSYDGNRYIVIATDHISRWSKAKALKSKSAKLVAKFLVSHIFMQHGPPKELLSDQGCEFLNKSVKTVCEILNTKKSFTSSYNPKCNGAAERVNQTLIGKLARLADERWSEWDEFLPYALYAYRISPRKATGNSPFELLYGRKENPLACRDREPPIVEENELLLERLRDARSFLLEEERSLRRAEINKTGLGHPTDDMEVGQFVRRRKIQTERLHKLDGKFDGIFKIISKGDKGSYTIRDLEGRKFNVNRKDILLIEESDPAEWISSKKGGMLGEETSLTLRLPATPGKGF